MVRGRGLWWAGKRRLRRHGTGGAPPPPRPAPLLAAGSRDAFAASVSNAAELGDSLDSSIENMIASLTAEELIVPANQSETTVEAGSWAFSGFSLESFSDLEDILGLDPIHEADPDKGWPAARD